MGQVYEWGWIRAPLLAPPSCATIIVKALVHERVENETKKICRAVYEIHTLPARGLGSIGPPFSLLGVSSSGAKEIKV